MADDCRCITYSDGVCVALCPRHWRQGTALLQAMKAEHVGRALRAGSVHRDGWDRDWTASPERAADDLARREDEAAQFHLFTASHEPILTAAEA